MKRKLSVIIMVFLIIGLINLKNVFAIDVENSLVKVASEKSPQTIANGTYKIESIINWKPAFDIKDGSKQDGAPIQLWNYVNAKQQKFYIKYESDRFLFNKIYL